MTALIVLCAIVLFFMMIFSLNLKLEIRISEKAVVRAGLGPVMLTLTPKKERHIDPRDFTFKKHQKRLQKERKKAAQKAEKKRLKNEKKAARKADAEKTKKAAEKAGEELPKKKFPFGFILALVKFVFRELGVFIGYFRVEIKALHVTVGGTDAAEIGKKYGYFTQAVPLFTELLKYKTRLKKIKSDAVSVSADFLSEKTTIQAHVRLRLPLGCILKVGIHALIWFIKQKIKDAKTATPEKQGKESAA